MSRTAHAVVEQRHTHPPPAPRRPCRTRWTASRRGRRWARFTRFKGGGGCTYVRAAVTQVGTKGCLGAGEQGRRGVGAEGRGPHPIALAACKRAKDGERSSQFVGARTSPSHRRSARSPHRPWRPRRTYGCRAARARRGAARAAAAARCGGKRSDRRIAPSPARPSSRRRRVGGPLSCCVVVGTSGARALVDGGLVNPVSFRRVARCVM